MLIAGGMIGGADPDTVMLLNLNGANGSTTMTDSSRYKHTVSSANAAALTTSVFKYGTASLFCDGSNDFIFIPDHAELDFAAGDFTIEMWVYPLSGSGDDFFLSKGTSTQPGPYELGVSRSTGTLIVSMMSTSVFRFAYQLTCGAITLNAWNHVGLERTGTTIRVYRNGVVGRAFSHSGFLWNNASPVNIGRGSINNFSYSYFAGYVDDVRFSKVARYSGAFTPPTSQLNR